MVRFWWPWLWPYLMPVWSVVGFINATGGGRVTVGPVVTIGGGGENTKSNTMISTTGDLTRSWVGVGLILTRTAGQAGAR
jgi:hypothetical protein